MNFLLVLQFKYILGKKCNNIETKLKQFQYLYKFYIYPLQRYITKYRFLVQRLLPDHRMLQKTHQIIIYIDNYHKIE